MENSWKKFPYILKKRFSTWEAGDKFLKDPVNDESESDDANLKILQAIFKEIRNKQQDSKF